jgi:putative ABC transport system ATP-binding protein
MNEGGLTLIVVTHDPAIGRRARRTIHLLDGAIARDHDVAAPPS